MSKIDELELGPIARNIGIGRPDDESGVDAVMALLEHMKAAGCVILIKRDSERSKNN